MRRYAVSGDAGIPFHEHPDQLCPRLVLLVRVGFYPVVLVPEADADREVVDILLPEEGGPPAMPRASERVDQLVAAARPADQVVVTDLALRIAQPVDRAPDIGGGVGVEDDAVDRAIGGTRSVVRRGPRLDPQNATVKSVKPVEQPAP